MVQIGRSWSLFGICIFVVAALIAPFFTHSDYNWVRHTTGELAGQQMPNAWIMRVGFISLGFGVFFDALQLTAKHRRDYYAFMVFGVCMIGAGSFNQRSIDTTQFFAAPLAHWHGFFFLFAAIALVVGISWRAYVTQDKSCRIGSIVVVALLAGLVPFVFLMPQFAGAAERAVLFAALLWLAMFFRHRAT
ncbi:DUF998 domain-containing protein [Maritalea porphyrae]|jgi:hypothetical membrane protein|uniref:DUF998 domain-containing protein n=1 Tax=Maritalea porphyrae TaxID=880732 RepID=UPI0022B078D4|nr:DUF998 domain-containing protein [Maritalea porphyrae]MCZ4272418.1 DUF998 domain-containing protein [Maritalea porphyrae]